MLLRLIIIILIVAGVYAFITKDQSSDDSNATTIAPVSQDTMPKMSAAEETSQLVAELKVIPASEYAVNKMKYERLLELNPGNERYIRKVAHYAQKMAEN